MRLLMTILGGVEIVAVRPGSSVWSAGPRRGGVLTSVNQEEVASTEEFAANVKASPRRLLLNMIRDDNAFFVVSR
jgi:S1-C subfamily serine protease